jgi:hypothetical protein
MMYELNWCGIYMPIWLVCLILGGLLSVVLPIWQRGKAIAVGLILSFLVMDFLTTEPAAGKEAV